MNETLVLLDVGNTTMGVAVSRGGQRAVYVLPTPAADTPDALGLRITGILDREGVAPGQVAAWVAASVVPHLEETLARACARYGNSRLLMVPGDIPLLLENRFQRPQEVGADRLVTAFAAHRLHQAPGVVVVDFGTATTFDCVEGAAYLGGLICPGVRSAAASLFQATAKLPQATLRLEEAELPGQELPIGRSTAQSLNLGLSHGFAAMTEGLVGRLKRQMPADTVVVATGGFAPAMARLTDVFDQVREDLLFHGLETAYHEAASSGSGRAAT
jgi:type III pantothenate kinase